jgi:Sister chromatid cohesion protein Dcc1
MNIFQPDGTTVKNPVTLLTLPSDEVEYQHGTAVETSSTTSSSSFVLLQLPLNFTVDDFIVSTNNTTTPNTYFVAAQNSNDANNHHQQQQPDAVCCVVESKACSFTVHRIETSNTLILVPPSSTPPSSITECTRNTSTNDNQHEMITNDSDAIDDNSNENSNHASNDIYAPSKNKKMKGDTASKLTRVLSAHLVQKPISTSGGGGGGTSTSGSYFLELRRKHLRLSDLRRALTVLDPYNVNHIDKNDDTATIGRTIFDLATSLQVSQLEIQQGLHHIGAYALPSKSSTNQSYCLLAEYIMNDCYDAIVTGLYTMSDCTDDYGGTNGIINIDQLTFIKNIIHHIQGKDDVIVTNLESILLHCLQLLEKETILSHGKFILDVSKVRDVVKENTEFVPGQRKRTHIAFFIFESLLRLRFVSSDDCF